MNGQFFWMTGHQGNLFWFVRFRFLFGTCL
jgi:hypothetical protein